MSDNKDDEKTLLSEVLPAPSEPQQASPRSRTIAHMRKLMAVATLSSSACVKDCVTTEAKDDGPSRQGSGYEVVDMLPPPPPRTLEDELRDERTLRIEVRRSKKHVELTLHGRGVEKEGAATKTAFGATFRASDPKLPYQLLIVPSVSADGKLTLAIDSEPWAIVQVDGTMLGKTPRDVALEKPTQIELLSPQASKLTIVLVPVSR